MISINATPDPAAVSLADLPAPDTRRWVARRKAAVARAVLSGALTRTEAQQRWNLSDEELDLWIERLALAGERALKATQVWKYRR